MRSAITLVLPGQHTYPDPELEARLDAEACTVLRDSALCERDYTEWESNLSQALIECQYWAQQCSVKLSPLDNPAKLEAGPGLVWLDPDPLEAP